MSLKKALAAIGVHARVDEQDGLQVRLGTPFPARPEGPPETSPELREQLGDAAGELNQMLYELFPTLRERDAEAKLVDTELASVSLGTRAQTELPPELWQQIIAKMDEVTALLAQAGSDILLAMPESFFDESFGDWTIFRSAPTTERAQKVRQMMMILGEAASRRGSE